MRALPGSALALALLAGCRSAAETAPPSPAPPPVAAPPAAGLTEAEAEAKARAEMEAVLFDRHLATARRYRDAFELEEAARHVDRALALRPTSDEARALRLELQRLLGERAGEAESFLADEWEASRAREEQAVVQARRALAEAREAEAAGDLDRAIAAYERAVFLAGRARARDRGVEGLRAEAESAVESAAR